MEKIKVYRCDPDKNDMCNKKYCYRKKENGKYLFYYCKHTFYSEYKMNAFKRLKEALGIGRKKRR